MHQHIPFDCKADEIVLFFFSLEISQRKEDPTIRKSRNLCDDEEREKKSTDATD